MYTSVFTSFAFLITFIHPPFASRSLTLKVSFLFTYIVSYIQRYCHIRSPPSALQTATLSLPLAIISSVHFILSPPLPLNMPVRGLYVHGKGSYGHGLAHTLPVPALYRHGKGVSALTGLLFSFLLMKDLMGSHSYCHDVTLNILSSVYIFNTLLPDCFGI